MNTTDFIEDLMHNEKNITALNKATTMVAIVIAANMTVKLSRVIPFSDQIKLSMVSSPVI